MLPALLAYRDLVAVVNETILPNGFSHEAKQSGLQLFRGLIQF